MNYFYLVYYEDGSIILRKVPPDCNPCACVPSTKVILIYAIETGQLFNRR